MAKGIGESLHIPGWRSGGRGLGDTPPKALPARGHDSLQPQIPRPGARWQCLILALTPNGDTTRPQLSTAAAPNAGLCPGRNPSPHDGAAEASPPWSTTSDRAKSEAAVAGKEQAPRLVGCSRTQGSPEVRASCPCSFGAGPRWVWAAVTQEPGRLSVLPLADTCLWLLPVPWHRNTRQ